MRERKGKNSKKETLTKNCSVVHSQKIIIKKIVSNKVHSSRVVVNPSYCDNVNLAQGTDSPP